MQALTRAVAIVLLYSMCIRPARSLTATVGLYTTQSPLFSAPDALTNSSSVAYYGFFQVGTPGQWFRACFDTGSSATWVPSATCESPSCDTHVKFNANHSTTFMTAEDPFTVLYVTGSIIGTVFFDTVNVGGIELRSQGLGLAERETADFALANCDGLFGLSFPTASSTRQNLSMPFLSMVRNKLLDAPLFSLWLNPESTKSYAGELVFGKINRLRYTDELQYATVEPDSNGPRYWQVAMNSLAVGSATIEIEATSIVIDSGSSLIFASQEDAGRINSAIPGLSREGSSSVFVLSSGCSAVDMLPSITISAGNLSLSLEPAEYIIQRAPDDDRCCVSSIVGITDRLDYLVLGSPFLRAYYTVYEVPDADNLATARIGFAPASGRENDGNVTSFLGV